MLIRWVRDILVPLVASCCWESGDSGPRTPLDRHVGSACLRVLSWGLWPELWGAPRCCNVQKKTPEAWV